MFLISWETIETKETIRCFLFHHLSPNFSSLIKCATHKSFDIQTISFLGFPGSSVVCVALWERLKFPFPNGKEPFLFCGVCPFVCLADSLAQSGLSGTCQVKKTENRGVLANVNLQLSGKHTHTHKLIINFTGINDKQHSFTNINICNTRSYKFHIAN